MRAASAYIELTAAKWRVAKIRKNRTVIAEDSEYR